MNNSTNTVPDTLAGCVFSFLPPRGTRDNKGAKLTAKIPATNGNARVIKQNYNALEKE